MARLRPFPISPSRRQPALQFPACALRRTKNPPTPEENIAAAQAIATSASVACQVSQANFLGLAPDGAKSYEAVCGFDLGLLAGTGRFVSGGEDYSLMLMHSDHSTRHFRNLAARMFPNLPEVPVDAIVILKGNPRDPVGTAPITLLKDLIAAEKPRLEIYQADRLRHQQARAAYEKANPVLPRDETYWFKPHRGSRYLANPQPEAAAR